MIKCCVVILFEDANGTFCLTIYNGTVRIKQHFPRTFAWVNMSDDSDAQAPGPQGDKQGHLHILQRLF